MKIIFIVLLFITPAQGSILKSSGLTTKDPVIKKRKFFRILSHMEETFQYLAIENDEELNIMGGWNEPTADMAFARRWDSAQVLIYRGMAHRPELNTDALMLIVCHEIGHLYGGAPYSNVSNGLSLEGQADYFATGVCLEKALKSFRDSNIEERINQAMLNVGKFLANNRSITHPQFDTPDLSIVDETLLTHPAPQCRLDTFLAGYEFTPRPSCWFATLLSNLIHP